MKLFHNWREKWFKRQKLTQRTISIFLAVLLLCLSTFGNFSYALAEEAKEKFSSIARIDSVKLYYNNIDEEVEQDAILKQDTILDLWYTFEITAENASNISANIPYYLDISSHLILPNWNGKSEELKIMDENGMEKEAFAELHSNGTDAWLTFNESTNESYSTVVEEYGGVENAYFYLECRRAANPPEAGADENYSNNQFLIKFEKGEPLSFGYWELAPVYDNAKLAKSGERAENIITWTIEYTPVQNPELENVDIKADTAFELRDTIDIEKHNLITGSLCIGTEKIPFFENRENINNTEAYAFCETDTDGNTLLIIGGTKLNAGKATNGKPAQSLKITYQTKVVDTLLLNTLTTVPDETSESAGEDVLLLSNDGGSEVTITNDVRLYANTGTWNALDVQDSANIEIPQPTWVTKTGTTTRQTNGAITEWTITFHSNGFTFNDLTLHDQLPEYSTLDDSTVDVTVIGGG